VSDDLLFDPLYPDVLGAITSERVHGGDVQVAVGVFPRSVYLNQPVEVVVVCQSMIDQPLGVRVSLSLPTRDRTGAALKLDTPRKTIEWTMKPGEVGVLRTPVVPLAPTPPGTDYPIRVSVQAKAARPGRVMRSPIGGAPPSVLAVSPFKLQVLRDVEYLRPRPGDRAGGDGVPVTAYFDLADRKLPVQPGALKPLYDVLWTAEQMPAERQSIASHLEAARMLASTFATRHVYPAFMRAVDDAFAANGMPLHPGETRAIARMLTYTVNNDLALDPTYQLEDQRWFQALAQALAADETLAEWEPGDLVVRYLFEAAVYDAILLGFALIRPRVRANLGDRVERVRYADRVLRWLAGQGEPDTAYIYLPLVLGGLAVNAEVLPPDEDPWDILDAVSEAQRGRVRLASGGVVEVFDLVAKMLERAEEDLRRARIVPGRGFGGRAGTGMLGAPPGSDDDDR
jgi:hypothetical protein